MGLLFAVRSIGLGRQDQRTLVWAQALRDCQERWSEPATPSGEGGNLFRGNRDFDFSRWRKFLHHEGLEQLLSRSCQSFSGQLLQE